MNYTPNPQLFASAFVLPAVIADEHLALTSSVQLRVILAVFRTSSQPFDIGSIMSMTGLSEQEVSDACRFWAQAGILLCNGENISAAPTASEVAHTVVHDNVEDVPFEPVGDKIILVPPTDDSNTDQIVVIENTPQHAEMFSGETLPAPVPKTEVVNATPSRKIHTDPITMEVAMDATTKAALVTEQAKKEKREAARKDKEKITVSPTRPTHAQICKRLDECAEVRELFNEAQTVLGRLMGTGDQAALLLLYDYYGLPADVILMLCEYARTRGKAGNLNYIYSVGQDWSEREIDTFERADEELRRLAKVDDNWTALCARTGMQHEKPTKGQQKYLSVWLNEWHFSIEMVALAYEKMTEHTDGIRFSYMNGILKSWYQKGIKTVAEVEAEEKQFREKTSATPVATAKTDRRAPRTDGVSAAVAKSGIADGPASYDLEKAELAARTSVPKLRKRKKK